ncbi:hypothetical protein BCV72DRAFT_131796 [Rhizopus microsporus var. microsporus]|uniref:Uncharacterized protein n=2 Tax=Rhizopus microsporus TaxID=58291 RepID=A0A2G4T5Z4_RHIZD|nr:uncharacterized protein RHIMIDRAFT_266096 [Rhizopus microsporus ATCC 52813]ORE05967.1 hypothetical protein BCV72DRAFT_131796 [Rhizopus microsporus var. microsporus]PHZ16432.1 hypothetical protein RHIMIDRAFT_266096 [Rhizopus microsporus ATCC 52813]
MDKKQHSNVGDVDDLPPPSYEEVINPPFNPNYSASSSTAQPQPQPSISRPIYPQLPSPPPAVQHHVRYQTIEIPMPVQTQRRRMLMERRQFPIAAVFFLFGWFCPPLWILGACCCAGSRNEYEAWWGKVNFVMAVALLVSSIFYSIFTCLQYY